jgi:3-deoxy-D-manno-octulosonic-acid transferase
MQTVWQTLYSYCIIPLLWVLLQAAGLVDRKVRRGIRGRVGLEQLLRRQIAALAPGLRVWFHASSMGEFEQAKPVIAELKRRHPDVLVIATFFSPSGYDHSRSYPLADVISYLPFDSRAGARMFVEQARPDVAVMVRYDVWPNHIWELHRRGIPVMIANATMRSTTLRRMPIARSFHHHLYDAIDSILTVSESDVQAFGAFRLRHARLAAIGDTRYDQVSQRSAEARRRNIIPAGILSGKRVIVAGSTWPEDEEVLLPAASRLLADGENILLILVPHEPTVEHLEELEAKLRGKSRFIRFSGLNEYAGEQVIIVDSIGILLTLYASAHVAYVGGSFRQGVHNVLEAAVYGIPVLFGPRHRNSREPLHLVEQGGGFVVNGTGELYRALENLLRDDAARTSAGERALQFVRSQTGATGRFLDHLEPLLHRANNQTPAS